MVSTPTLSPIEKPSGPVQMGDTGRDVKLVQEWLCLHDFNVGVDSEFGPATRSAVTEFQESNQLPVTGIVNDGTFDALVAPMVAALKPIDPANQTLGSLTVAYAKQHLKQEPRELDKRNLGPWVRLYMDGHDGPAWPWCAGFACFCLQQAAGSLSVLVPIKKSFSCDVLAYEAKNAHILLTLPAVAQRKNITPGSFFLRRRQSGEWMHTGIVQSADDSLVRTIEGNTNDNGSADGYEVLARTRAYGVLDFIMIT